MGEIPLPDFFQRYAERKYGKSLPSDLNKAVRECDSRAQVRALLASQEPVKTKAVSRSRVAKKSSDSNGDESKKSKSNEKITE